MANQERIENDTTTSTQVPSSSKRNTHLVKYGIIIACIIILAFAYDYYASNSEQTNTTTNTTMTVTSVTPQENPVVTQEVYLPSGKESPDGTYTVTEINEQGYSYINITNAEGEIITNDLINDNQQTIIANNRIMCPCSPSFKGWVNNDTFSLHILTANNETYEYLVDAFNARLIESLFRKVQ